MILDDNLRVKFYLPLDKHPVCCHLSGGGIMYLNDLDRYAGWSFYAPVRATQARQVEG